MRLACREKPRFEKYQEPSQRDTNGREKDVKCDVGRKLHAGQNQRIK